MRIAAFQRDLLTVDCICLFLSGKDDTGIELDEEIKGWTDLCDALPRFLPGCRPFHEWFRLVAHPAFTTNRVEIHSRPTTGNG
jgi:hypothetical protein